MSEAQFHGWSMFLQIVSTLGTIGALIGVIYYVGKFVGVNTKTLETVQEDQKEIKENLKEHIQQDLAFQKDISSDIANLRVLVAENGKGGGAIS